MPKFTYEGILNGKKIKGTVEASSEEEALKFLENKGIIPLKVSKTKELLQIFKINFHRKKVSLDDLAFALIQLATLLEAGIPLTRALELLANQVENEELASVFIKIKRDIEEGVEIAQAFKSAEIFPEFLPEMLAGVRTGENLEFIFKIAGEYLERLSEIRGKIISSITYPAFVITFSFLAVVVAVKFVVPKLISVLESFGKEPPLITKLIIALTNLFIYSLFLLPILLTLLWFKRDFLYSERFGKILIRTPIIGKLLLYINLARFAKTLSMLLEAAVPLPEAVRLAVGSITLPPLKRELEEVVPQIEKGKSLSSTLKKINFIPPLFVNLVETGEVGGELEKMLKLLSETYEKETFRIVDFWIRMIEPLSILLIAVVVGVIVISVILPMAQLSTSVR